MLHSESAFGWLSVNAEESRSLRMLQAQKEHANLDYYIINRGYTRKEISTVNRNRTATARKYSLVDDECHAFEVELDLEQRWTCEMPEYREAEKELLMRKYYKSVDTLERLIVQRLFELTKLGMSGVGKNEARSYGSSTKL